MKASLHAKLILAQTGTDLPSYMHALGCLRDKRDKGRSIHRLIRRQYIQYDYCALLDMHGNHSDPNNDYIVTTPDSTNSTLPSQGS